MPRDSDSSDRSRRRFLKATGTVAVTAGVAGCGGGGPGAETTEPGADDPGNLQDTTAGDGTAETTGTDGGGTATDQAPFDVDGWPYGVGETRIEEAKRVMEEAGYGEDNRFQLNWLQYKSPTWSEMASTISSRLGAAYIDMNQREAAFSPLLEATRNGNHQAYTLGWVADYPGPQNFVQLVDPPNTMYGSGDTTSNGARLFWSEDANASQEVRQYMVEQFDRIENNPQDTEEARQIRQDAAVNMEEGMWEEAVLLPLYQGIAEPMWYDRVDYRPPGPMNPSRAKASRSVRSIQGKDQLDGISSTFSSLDPIASGNTASGGKIMDMFDALTNYRNATTEVENLLASDYSVSDDFTTYTFQLKEGATFHNGDEVTAQDFVYSIKRLMASSNSTNARFPLSVLGIEHETETVQITDDEGNVETATDTGEPKTTTRVIPDSIGVEATGDYELQITLERPFSYALSVLAYSAFSAVPEGIVGDLPGYEGEMSWAEFSQSPVGAGPFQFENWESGNGGEFRMSTYQDYHGEGASFSGTHDAILTETQATYNYFLNGNADIGGVPTSQYQASNVNIETTDDIGRELGTYQLQNGNTVNMARVPEIGTFYIGFNLQKVPKPVRKAMAYIINRPAFMENVFKGRYQSAYHLTPPQIYPGGIEAYNQHYQGSGGGGGTDTDGN